MKRFLERCPPDPHRGRSRLKFLNHVIFFSESSLGLGAGACCCRVRASYLLESDHLPARARWRLTPALDGRQSGAGTFAGISVPVMARWAGHRDGARHESE